MLSRVALPGARRVRISLMIAWYCLSSAVVASGALRYFSNRAWNSRLLLMFQVLPSHDRRSEPGSNIGTSLPRNLFGSLGAAAPSAGGVAGHRRRAGAGAGVSGHLGGNRGAEKYQDPHTIQNPMSESRGFGHGCWMFDGWCWFIFIPSFMLSSHPAPAARPSPRRRP